MTRSGVRIAIDAAAIAVIAWAARSDRYTALPAWITELSVMWLVWWGIVLLINMRPK